MINLAARDEPDGEYIDDATTNQTIVDDHAMEFALRTMRETFITRAKY